MTNAQTGEPEYFDKTDLRQDDYSVLKASCAIPLVCHPYEVRGVPYYDGALGDTIPLRKAFALGCDKVVLILTKPAELLRTPKKDRLLAGGIRRRYPLAAERMRHRAEQYNRGVALAKEYAKSGRVCIIAPDDTCGVDTLTKDRDALNRFYDKGYRDGKALEAFL